MKSCANTTANTTPMSVNIAERAAFVLSPTAKKEPTPRLYHLVVDFDPFSMSYGHSLCGVSPTPQTSPLLMAELHGNSEDGYHIDIQSTHLFTLATGCPDCIAVLLELWKATGKGSYSIPEK